MDSRDKLIVKQVAFKGAIELLALEFKQEGKLWNDEEVFAKVKQFTDEFAKIIESV